MYGGRQGRRDQQTAVVIAPRLCALVCTHHADTSAVVTVECHQRNFEGDALCYRQQVQRVSEYWRDVVASTDSGDEPRGGTVQGGLQSSVDAVRNAAQKSVTV